MRRRLRGHAMGRRSREAWCRTEGEAGRQGDDGPLRRGRSRVVGHQHLHGRQRPVGLRALRASGSHGHRARRPGVRRRTPCRRFRAQLREVGSADLEAARRREHTARRRRQAGTHRSLAGHDQRRVLQVDRRRGGEESPRSAQHRRARVHHPPRHRRQRPVTDCRCGGFQCSRSPAS